MVLAILVDTTSPIRVLRRPAAFCVLVVVSAIAYFFSIAAFLLAAFFAGAAFPAATFFAGAAFLAAVSAGAAALAGALVTEVEGPEPLPAAICFCRITVCTRAISF